MILSTGIASEPEKVDKVTSVLSVLSVLLVLFATPSIVTLGWIMHLGLFTVFNTWTYVSIFTLMVLAVLSMYQMLIEEARKSKENGLAEIKHDLSSLLKYRQITVPFLVLSIASGIGYLLHLFNVYFSLDLIYSAVFILALETLFHSLYKFWPKFLKKSARLQNSSIAIIVFVGLIFSLFVIGTAGVILVSFLFAGFILVGGIGLAFVVDITANEVSRYLSARTKVFLPIVLTVYFIIVIWALLAGDIIGHLGAIIANGNELSMLKTLKSETQSLLTGTNVSLLSISLALAVTALYATFLKFKKAFVGTNLFFALISVPVAGFVFLYLAIMTDGDWVASIVRLGDVYSYLLQLIPSIALFAVGYSQILVEIPRKTSRLMMQEENKLLVTLTWLVLFSALAEFLSWLVYGQPGEFIFEADLIQWFGIPIGIALLSAKYVKIRRKSNFATN